ncbi:MAG: hypothetical protein ACI4TJ_01230 [Candidatus Cryptobacteroides sp.]
MKTSPRTVIALMSAVILVAAASCTGENPDKDNIQPSAERIYILNNGGYGANNASLSVLDLETGEVTADIFSAANACPLGDTANDLLVLEDRIVIAVNGSNIIQVCGTDGKSLARTEIVPNVRKLVADEVNGWLYATSYADDGYVAKLSLDDCSLLAKAEVGYEPEGIVLYEGKLFVANTGGYAYLGGHGYEQTISVVDAATMDTIGTIDTGMKNLYGAFLQNGKYPEYILVNAAGDYGSSPAGSVIIDCKTCSVVARFDFPATYATTFGNSFFTIGSDYDATTHEYTHHTNRISVGPEGITVAPGLAPEAPSADDGVVRAVMSMSSPSGIFINADGSVFIADSGDYVNRGSIHRFNADGTPSGKFTVGVCPAQMAGSR